MKGPFSPLRLPLHITDLCISAFSQTKLLFQAFLAAVEQRGCSQEVVWAALLSCCHPDGSKAKLPAMVPAGTWGSPHLAASFLGAGGASAWQGPAIPPRGAPSHPTSLPETTALFSPLVLEGSAPALPAAPTKHQDALQMKL